MLALLHVKYSNSLPEDPKNQKACLTGETKETKQRKKMK